MRSTLAAIVVVVTHAGCAADDGDGDVITRWCNDTGRDMTELRWVVDGVGPGGPMDVPVSTCTHYEVAVGPAYRAPPLSFIVDGERYMYWQTDYYASDELDVGRWSYRLTIADVATHWVGVEAKAD